MATSEQLETYEERLTGFLEASYDLIKIGAALPRTSLARACSLQAATPADLERFGVFGKEDGEGKTTWAFEGTPAEAARAFMARKSEHRPTADEINQQIEKAVAAQIEPLVQRMRHYETRVASAETMLLELGVKLEKLPAPIPPATVKDVVPALVSVPPRAMVPSVPPPAPKFRILVVGPHPRDWAHIEKDIAPNIQIVRFETTSKGALPANADAAIWNENAGQFYKQLAKLYPGRVFHARASISHVRDLIRLVVTQAKAS